MDAAPRSPHRARPSRRDRLGIGLSGLCAVHCVGTLVLAGSLSVVLSNPLIHEVGLALALIIGLVAFGGGVARHARREPLMLGFAGLSLMAAALLIPHGPGEAALTVAGVVLLAAGHLWNGRIAGATAHT